MQEIVNLRTDLFTDVAVVGVRGWIFHSEKNFKTAKQMKICVIIYIRNF